MALTDTTPTIIRRADYQPPAYFIDTVDLSFDLDPAKTRVLNKMSLRRNPDVATQALVLNGEDLNLARVLVNGQGASFRTEGHTLVLDNLPDQFDLEIFTTCAPEKNTSLSGLYTSEGAFFTQCEAEGFRRITYFLDRPDVMALFTVTLRADKAKFPVLLSNGNLVAQADLPEGRHMAQWSDPHKKPCYLFALVGANLVCREQRIKSRSGTDHLLQVYVRPGDLDKTEHAMNSLMASVAWDETRFGLGLDLERFMIVAVSDFNMGAMENKGLNIFNTKYVLANPATATDADYAGIESVVGHEYFHNWTGNRVTCRDWFQLSLKEGLTVFRDQEFSMDLSGSASARAVMRIQDVRQLRSLQFAEDAGPMAHPVRPDAYSAIDNFYTMTVYEKGAEVVRMQQTLVGREGFRKGMDLYFARFDGQAVTCDDFTQAISDANPDSLLTRHLAQFKRWYSQAGTPRVSVAGVFDEAARTYTLRLSQSCAPTPGQPTKEPFVIPIELGLIGRGGEELATSRLHVLTHAQDTLVFDNIDQPPVLSILRGFSAPVNIDTNASDDDLLALLAHDKDAFNRWEAAQTLMLKFAINLIATNPLNTLASAEKSVKVELPVALVSALRAVLLDPQLDAAFKDLVLTLPGEGFMAEQLKQVDPQAVHAVREGMRQALACDLFDDWASTFEAHKDTGAFTPDAVSSGRRALTNSALGMLVLASATEPVWPGKALQRFKDASNMTDKMGALQALIDAGHVHAKPALERFLTQFKGEALVVDKWFALQGAACDRGGNVLPSVRALMQHPEFSLKNPNRARSLLFSYCNANPGAFHRTDAAGYVYWAEQVIALDAINPQVASRLARALDSWRKLTAPYQMAAQEALKRVAASPSLSADTREVLTRALAE